MAEILPFTKEPAFINRKKELNDLRTWISAKPEDILFLYGPKSSGKTTLLYRFIEQNLDSKYYDISHLNLRKLLLGNYRNFLRAFFEPKAAEMPTKTREYDLKVFKLSVETLKGLESRELDPFVVMKRELTKQVKKGKRPVIIIDELQALDEIYFNGQRELLKEMFNFFVAMTKESHLCHVIIASSDGYFIERIYNDSKLKKTSELMEIGYIERDDVMDWLHNLKKYSKIESFVLTDDQIDAMWDAFGGSCWELSNFLGRLLSVAENGRVDDGDFHNALEKKMIACRSLFAEYATIIGKKRRLCQEMATVISRQSTFTPEDLMPLVEDNIWESDELLQELNMLVRQNFLSYAPPRAEYALQGRSMEQGLLRYAREMQR